MFKANFIRLCNKKGESPSSVCRSVGIAPATFSCWTDESVPRKATLMRIADYLGVSVDELLGNDAPAPVSPAITLTPEEQLVALRYRSVNPDTQAIIRKILDIPNGDEELIPVYHAARSKDGTAEDRIIYRTREEIERLENAPESDIDI